MYIYISRRVLVVLSIVLLVAVAGGVALAGVVSQEEDNVIYACYHNKTGRLRVVSGPEECKHSESPISWNREGPPGPQGPPGPPGTSGPLPFFVCSGCDWQYIGDRLVGVDLTDAYMPGARFQGVNLSNVILSGAILVYSRFSGANLSSAVLIGADLRWTVTAGADFTGADLTNANMGFSDGTTNMMRNVLLVNANLTNAQYTFSDFSNADLTGADLTGANFFGSNFTDANLTDVIWSNTVCPDGTNSDDNGGTCEGHLTPAG